MAFIRDLYHDEIRDGWLVKSDTKKIWERQLEIWQEVDRIYRKHKITYWAAYGTLLGAARHAGFIPWDDDFDICMMRPDYNRFSEIVDAELGESFKIEYKVFLVTKIANLETTLIDKENIKGRRPKGLILDIFPFDVAYDGTTDSFLAMNAINKLLVTIYNYPAVVCHVQQGGKTINDWEVIEILHATNDINKQLDFVSSYGAALFNQSTTVDWLEEFILKTKVTPRQKYWYRETIYLPFESVQLPAPIDYDKVLKSYYGDWRKFVRDNKSHCGIIHSADLPCEKFFKLADLDFILEG